MADMPPDAQAGPMNIHDQVMEDSINGLIESGLARGDANINETPDEWHKAAWGHAIGRVLDSP